MADGGTLFLDEIGDMPLELQGHLLRVIENKCFTRIGGNKKINTNIRIIAATNSNLRDKIREKQFRADLFYRLNIFNINIPPLSQRPKDIVPLANYFLHLSSCEKGVTRFELSDEAKAQMLLYDWPGNIRELRSVCLRASSISDTKIISGETMMQSIYYGFGQREGQRGFQDRFNGINKPLDLGEKNDSSGINTRRRLRVRPNQLSSSELEKALLNSNYNVSKAAKKLGISRTTLYRLMEKYGFMA